MGAQSELVERPCPEPPPPCALERRLRLRRVAELEGPTQATSSGCERAGGESCDGGNRGPSVLARRADPRPSGVPRRALRHRGAIAERGDGLGGPVTRPADSVRRPRPYRTPAARDSPARSTDGPGRSLPSTIGLREGPEDRGETVEASSRPLIARPKHSPMPDLAAPDLGQARIRNTAAVEAAFEPSPQVAEEGRDSTFRAEVAAENTSDHPDMFRALTRLRAAQARRPLRMGLGGSEP